MSPVLIGLVIVALTIGVYFMWMPAQPIVVTKTVIRIDPQTGEEVEVEEPIAVETDENGEPEAVEESEVTVEDEVMDEEEPVTEVDIDEPAAEVTTVEKDDTGSKVVKYKWYRGQYSPGNTMQVKRPDRLRYNLAALAKECNRRKSCKGFNTVGNLKNKISTSNLKSWNTYDPKMGIYVKTKKGKYKFYKSAKQKYKFYKNKNYSGHNIKYTRPKSLRFPAGMLRDYCTSHSGCVGITSRGEMKSKILPKDKWKTFTGNSINKKNYSLGMWVQK